MATRKRHNKTLVDYSKLTLEELRLLVVATGNMTCARCEGSYVTYRLPDGISVFSPCVGGFPANQAHSTWRCYNNYGRIGSLSEAFNSLGVTRL